MLLDVKGVELASTVDHVTVIEMNAIARLAGLNLLRKNRQISADIIVIEAVGAIFTHLQAILKEISAIKNCENAGGKKRAIHSLEKFRVFKREFIRKNSVYRVQILS